MPASSDFKGRKLYRSHVNRMIGGVCGGIAEYFHIDPTLVRLIWVTIALFGGIGVIVYLVSLIIIPNNPDQVPNKEGEKLFSNKSLFWGALFIVVGLFLLLRQFDFFYQFNLFNISWKSIWAIILIIIGIFLLYNKKLLEHPEKSGGIFKKKFYRSDTQKMISGVCGGIAEYFKIDVSIVRILWTVGTIASIGIGIIVYIGMVFIFPEKSENVNNNGV
jgi:phage shock protein C